MNSSQQNDVILATESYPENSKSFQKSSEEHSISIEIPGNNPPTLITVKTPKKSKDHCKIITNCPKSHQNLKTIEKHWKAMSLL